MGRVLKYLFYIALVLVIYLVGKGVYEGQINEATTVGEVVSDVATGTKEMVRSGVDAAGEAMDKASEAADDYKKAPKEDITIAE